MTASGRSGPKGPKGDKGDPGDPGAGGVPYVHEQQVASTTWVVLHELGYFPPAVQVTDSAGTVVMGRIRHDSINQLTLSFSAPFSGKAEVK